MRSLFFQKNGPKIFKANRGHLKGILIIPTVNWDTLVDFDFRLSWGGVR